MKINRKIQIILVVVIFAVILVSFFSLQTHADVVPCGTCGGFCICGSCTPVCLDWVCSGSPPTPFTTCECVCPCGCGTSGCDSCGGYRCVGTSHCGSQVCHDKGCTNGSAIYPLQRGSCYDNTTTQNCDCEDCSYGPEWKNSGFPYSCCSPDADHLGEICLCQKQEEWVGACHWLGCTGTTTGNTQTIISNCADHCKNSVQDCGETGMNCGDPAGYCPSCTCWSHADCKDYNDCTQNICAVPGTDSCAYPLWCSGADTECACQLPCANCNNQDGWHNIGTPNYSCCDRSMVEDKDHYCTCQDQEYRDYYCSDFSCQHNVIPDPITGKSHQTIYNFVKDCDLSDDWYDVEKGNDGVIYGATYTSDTPDGSGFALDFNGTSDYVSIPDSYMLDISEEMSFEAWIKLDNLPSETGKIQALLRKGDEYIILIDNNDKIQFLIFNGADWTPQAVASSALSKNQWHHIAATMSFNGSIISKKIYIDGVICGSNNTQTGNISSGNEVLLIGYGGGSILFDGKIDEVRFYKRALNPTEIEEHFEGTFKDETGLMGLWHMDEGSVDLPPNWFDANWKYRKPVNITGSLSNLFDYQALLTINTEELISQGKMKSDCSDIKFANSSGTIEIAYWIEDWIEGCNTDSTKIWVKIPSIPIAGTTAYMYYGNSLALSASDGANTFILFDDFSTDTDSLWGRYVDGSYIHYVRPMGQTLTSARLRWVAKLHNVDSKSGGIYQEQGLRSGENYSLLKSSANTYISTATESEPAIRFFSKDGTQGSGGVWANPVTEGHTYLWQIAFNSSKTKANIWNTSGNNVYSTYQISFLPNQVEYHYIFHMASEQLKWYSGSPNYLRSYVQSSGGDSILEYRYYWIFVSKYASPEPKSSTESEESIILITIDTISQTCAGDCDCSFSKREERDYYCTPDCAYNITDYETTSAPCGGCALEGEDCSSMSCCDSPPAPEPLTCVDHICRVCTAPTCSADDAEDNSISEMGDSIDDVYCTWNIHDGCCVQEGVETVDGSNNPSYWEGEDCVDSGSSDLWGEKKVYIDDINDYNIKGEVCVDDYNSFWINSVQVNSLENGSTGCTGLQDVRSFFQTGWNTIKFKAVDTCSGDRYMDIDWEIKPRFPFLNGNAISSSEVSLSWSDRGAGVTYHLYNFNTSSYIYIGDQISFDHTGLDSNETYSYLITAEKNGYLSEEDGPPLYRDKVSVTTWNNPPVADAGLDRFVVIGSTVDLDGSGSNDPDGDPITYDWTFNSIPGASSLTDADFSNETIVNPNFTPDVIGVYLIDLTVTDIPGGFDTDTVSITVANPTICGDNNIQCLNSNGLCEECDGTDDILCPGECVAPGEIRECLCPLSMPEWKEVKPKKE